MHKPFYKASNVERMSVHDHTEHDEAINTHNQWTNRENAVLLFAALNAVSGSQVCLFYLFLRYFISILDVDRLMQQSMQQ